jgi:hypothetical protein
LIGYCGGDLMNRNEAVRGFIGNNSRLFSQLREKQQ